MKTLLKTIAITSFISMIICIISIVLSDYQSYSINSNSFIINKKDQYGNPVENAEFEIYGKPVVYKSLSKVDVSKSFLFETFIDEFLHRCDSEYEMCLPVDYKTDVECTLDSKMQIIVDDQVVDFKISDVYSSEQIKSLYVSNGEVHHLKERFVLDEHEDCTRRHSVLSGGDKLSYGEKVYSIPHQAYILHFNTNGKNAGVFNNYMEYSLLYLPTVEFDFIVNQDNTIEVSNYNVNTLGDEIIENFSGMKLCNSKQPQLRISNNTISINNNWCIEIQKTK